jgi:hypothetical protein
VFASYLAARHIKQTARAEPGDYFIVDAFLAADLRALVAEQQVVERVEGVGSSRIVRVEGVLVFWFRLRGAFGGYEAATARAWACVVCVRERCRHGEAGWAGGFILEREWLAFNVSPRHSRLRAVFQLHVTVTCQQLHDDSGTFNVTCNL